MKFTLDARAGINLIRAYSERELMIGERVVVASCIVTADTLITDWSVTTPDELNLILLAPLLALTPQIVLLGAPAQSSAAPANLRSLLAQQGIALEVMDLGAACRTFNILVQEERRVAAALFLEKEPP
jgi:uncharacterized protein